MIYELQISGLSPKVELDAFNFSSQEGDKASAIYNVNVISAKIQDL
ncbi:MAG: hypothetical protein ACI9G9_001080 [Psychromonas sp.]|jgi:hypothetical protein